MAVDPDARSLELASDLSPELTLSVASVLLRILRKEHDRQPATEDGRPVDGNEALAS